MTQARPAQTDADELRQERDRLRAEVARLTGQVEALNTELGETNKGVVALYAELDDKAEQLRQASELKSRFLSYMSHEFRTPLGSIRSIARILLDRLDGPLTAEQEKQVKFVQDSASDFTFPDPRNVAGSGFGRSCSVRSTTFAPAASARPASSSIDRSASMRRARPATRPTSAARSVPSTLRSLPPGRRAMRLLLRG